MINVQSKIEVSMYEIVLGEVMVIVRKLIVVRSHAFIRELLLALSFFFKKKKNLWIFSYLCCF